MSICGGLLIFLALPLFIGYAISEKKNSMWLRLGAIMGAVGLVIIIVSNVVQR